jgi:hypothetical protein
MENEIKGELTKNLSKKILPGTLSGFDLTTHNFTGGDDATT